MHSPNLHTLSINSVKAKELHSAPQQNSNGCLVSRSTQATGKASLPDKTTRTRMSITLSDQVASLTLSEQQKPIPRKVRTVAKSDPKATTNACAHPRSTAPATCTVATTRSAQLLPPQSSTDACLPARVLQQHQFTKPAQSRGSMGRGAHGSVSAAQKTSLATQLQTSEQL